VSATVPLNGTGSFHPVGTAPDTPRVPTNLDEAATSNDVQTKKWRLHYHDAGDGHPLVFLHGSGPGATGWTNFRTNLGPLAERHRVLAVDMPGWGQSDTATPDDRDHLEALELFLDALGLERVALIGNSMGGMTALRFTAAHPERVSHLVCMGAPAPGVNLFAPGGGPSEGLKVLIGAYSDPSPANFKRLVQIMAFDSTFATNELAEQRSTAALGRTDHLENFLAAIPRGTMAGASLAAFTALDRELPQVPTPTLVVHGRDDRVVHYENALRLVSMIPNSRLVLINRCGHWAQIEHADEFNRLVDQFVTNH
jgi:2-hydroxy-6-oxonona-2,4-dienedioate hydrolase